MTTRMLCLLYRTVCSLTHHSTCVPFTLAVLDDNCMLCLPNGERIKLNPTTMRMLFEVGVDLGVDPFWVLTLPVNDCQSRGVLLPVKTREDEWSG